MTGLGEIGEELRYRSVSLPGEGDSNPGHYVVEICCARRNSWAENLVGHQEICGTRRESDRRARDPELGLRANSEYRGRGVDGGT